MGKTVENCDRSLRNIIAISIDPLLNTERIYFPARDCPFNLYSQAANKSAGRRPPPSQPLGAVAPFIESQNLQAKKYFENKRESRKTIDPKTLMEILRHMKALDLSSCAEVVVPSPFVRPYFGVTSV